MKVLLYIILLTAAPVSLAQTVKAGLGTEMYWSPMHNTLKSSLNTAGFGDGRISSFDSTIVTPHPFSDVSPSIIFTFERLFEKKISLGFKLGVIGRGRTVGYDSSDNIFLDISHHSHFFDISLKRYFGKHSLEISPGFINFVQIYEDGSQKSLSEIRLLTSLSYRYEIKLKERFSMEPFISARLIQRTDLGPFNLVGVSRDILFEDKPIHQAAFGIYIIFISKN